VKGARQKLLSSNEDMGKRYALIREFQEELGVSVERVTGITWPPEYDREIVTSAVKFLGLEEQGRRAARKVLTLEADGLEITTEDCIEVSLGEFTVPKEEED
jgi:8-oxo-dGTP pyrophosphatase MutT (NUDIX family)